MKKLNEVYVIVLGYGGQTDFFKDFVSFDKDELQTECDKLNEVFHDKTSKLGYPKLTPPYNILTLKDAIEIFRNDVADANTEHDESY
jgi:hypothetical protein